MGKSEFQSRSNEPNNLSAFERFVFRPIELWAVAILFILMICVSIGFGWTVYQHMARGGSGTFGKASIAVAKLPDTIHRVLKASESPYRVDEERFRGRSGFTFNYPPHTRPKAAYLLLNRHDGDINKGVSELVDLDSQETVHRWIFDVDFAWKDATVGSDLYDPQVDRSTFRFRPLHAQLLSDGSLVAKYKTPLVRADICNNLSLFNQDYIFHHSIESDSSGSLWTSAYLEPKTVNLGDEGFRDDAIIRIDPNGRISYQKSIAGILLENDLEYLIYGGYDKNDPIHVNDIEPVQQDGLHWKKGDLFLSLRHNSVIILYRPLTNEVVWMKQGPWVHQHDVDIIGDGLISVFSNNSYFRGNRLENFDYNEFFIYNFDSQNTETPFSAGFESFRIGTPAEGRSQLLESDDLFVEETNAGRLLVFSQDGELQWEYINRADSGDLYKLAWSRIIPRSFGDRIVQLIKDANCE